LPESEKKKGVVETWIDKKGYGFIKTDSGESIFVHFSGVAGDGFKKLRQGDKVEFDTEQGDKGIKAVNVVVTEKGPEREERYRPQNRNGNGRGFGQRNDRRDRKPREEKQESEDFGADDEDFEQ